MVGLSLPSSNSRNVKTASFKLNGGFCFQKNSAPLPHPSHRQDYWLEAGQSAKLSKTCTTEQYHNDVWLLMAWHYEGALVAPLSGEMPGALLLSASRHWISPCNDKNRCGGQQPYPFPLDDPFFTGKSQVPKGTRQMTRKSSI